MQVKKQQLELDMEQWTDSKLGKEYIKTVYHHPAYLTYMQSSCKMPGWMIYKLEIKIAGRNNNSLRCAVQFVVQSCPTLCNPLDCSPPGYSILGILQAKILEWVAMPSSMVSSSIGRWVL